jgi:hypothetical protein
MKFTKITIKIGRLFSVLSIIAFILTWFAIYTKGPILGRTETHLFNDSIILALFSIIFLLDGYLHSKNL